MFGSRALGGAQRMLLAAGVAVALAGAAGCGSSSKPAYCSDVKDFKSAVGDLGNVSVTNVSAVKAAIDKVESTGTAAVNSAKSAFPNQTTALKSSLGAIGATATQLTDPSTRKAALKQLPAEIGGVGSAAKSFEDATSSKCS